MVNVPAVRSFVVSPPVQLYRGTPWQGPGTYRYRSGGGGVVGNACLYGLAGVSGPVQRNHVEAIVALGKPLDAFPGSEIIICHRLLAIYSNRGLGLLGSGKSDLGAPGDRRSTINHRGRWGDGIQCETRLR